MFKENNFLKSLAIKRFQQQSKQNKGFSDIDVQEQQLKIIKKLYLKYDLILKCTCPACPEQYDVIKDNVKVAYIRLRHGCLYVDIPDCGDKRIFQDYPKGDGMFENDERMNYMSKILKIILNNL